MRECVKEKYKCTVSWLCAHGDEVGFLKKSYKLARDLGRSAPKASPMPTTVPLDEAELDNERSTLFRTAVGNLQADVVEAQFGIRWLAQHMSRPAAGALRVLRHMILYLKGTSSFGIGFWLCDHSEWAQHSVPAI